MKQFNPLFLFLQEHWLPFNEVDFHLSSDFPGYKFLSTASDMFTPAEDLMLTSGTAWQGTTIGWSSEIDKFVTKLPVISDRFCGVSYSDGKTRVLAYTAYFPTSGQDDDFLEVVDQLSADIKQHSQNCAVLIGSDTNQSEKSSKRRTEAMAQFRNEFFFKSILVSDKPTFHHNNQSSVSQIDTILYSIPDNTEIDLQFLEHLCVQKC